MNKATNVFLVSFIGTSFILLLIAMVCTAEYFSAGGPFLAASLLCCAWVLSGIGLLVSVHLEMKVSEPNRHFLDEEDPSEWYMED
jgi:hypothetical protein